MHWRKHDVSAAMFSSLPRASKPPSEVRSPPSQVRSPTLQVRSPPSQVDLQHCRFDLQHRRLNPHHRRFNRQHRTSNPTIATSIPTIAGSIPTSASSIPTILDKIPTSFSLSCVHSFGVVFNKFPYLNSCSPSLKRVQLELGGKSPLIIFSDCDMERAVRQVNLLYWSYFQHVLIQSYVTIVFVFQGLMACFFNKGENCIAAGKN